MLLTVTWPAKRPSTSIANGNVAPCAGLLRQPPHQRPERASAGPRRRAGRSRPTAPARRRCAAGPAPGVAASVGGQRPHASPRRSQASRPAGRLNGRSPRPARRRARSTGASTARRVLHPAARAGQVDDQAAADARRPARARAPRSGRPCARRTRGSPRRCPGTSTVQQRPGHLGGAVGRRQAGAAGGEHDPGAAVDGGRDRRRRPARRRARRPARRPRSPAR